ncbi:MAG: peptide ABC transporter substrate-binding protein [Chloroflexi bacterium]|nr:peptide ABC transporter substrate-binding protein [Chloroflexota bacterium]
MAALNGPTLRIPRARKLLLVLGLTIALAGGVTATGHLLGGPARAAGRDDVKIAASAPSTLDPAAAGDVGSAAVIGQLYESLTTFDASLALRPALAASWDVSDDGRQVVFHLRPGLVFSDGTPITADDVVGSWLRVVDPAAPSPLSALLLGVHGAADRLAGRDTNPDDVGIHARDGAVVVDLDRPGSDFPAIAASPTFGIVPPSVWRDGGAIPETNQVVSGAYSITATTSSELTLTANGRYWAGRPAITTVHLIDDIGGRSPVVAFEAGDVDAIAIASNDASWIAYDPTLGPQLRRNPDLSLTYLGFDTSRPPFDDVRVRRAVGAAVDWSRIATLGVSGGEIPADSMVPPGIPGRGDRSWLPAHDPAAARQLLADAGYPGGRGFPVITLGAGGAAFAEGIAADLGRELGITVRVEDAADHFARLTSDPPAMWELGWIADYPGPNDFLGVLLGSGSSSNPGKWSSAAFDSAIAEALGTRDPAVAQAAFARALAVVQGDVPAVPLAYSDSWSLTRTGLLGAGENGLGFKRFAGLAWAP